MRQIVVTGMLVLVILSCGRKNDDGKADAPVTLGGGKPSASESSHKVIQNKGSDTLVNVAQAWAEEYSKVKPEVAVAVSGGGSGTGISALINGTVDIANASREMKDKEIDAAKKNGIDPVKFIVGHDAIAIYLHKDNPIKELTLAQIASIYADGGEVEKWSQLGVKVPGCDSDEIIRVSRQNNSGTYECLKELVLKKEFKLGSKDMNGSKEVVDLVEKTPCAIGYSGLAYATPNVKMPCVKKDDASTCVAPTVASASDGTYPIARALLMYTRGKPEGAVKDYMDWILGDKGQCIIADKGYAPAVQVTCK
jgi:phosphate transport system substrate-binding protein